ncbi:MULTISPECIES: helix-turn-helix transcriptional regulator [Agrobacterium]|uniref:LuxR family transcriptional regulator n=1 Tax=Agrobacterium rubi TaxID=28099 RepID=A0AAE7R7L5_9HYPH|nr:MULTISPECIES: LuxR family transcriptional regulator [Agrobacterium]MBN7807782.1 LuxR family transcriptional regulator [Agrobacterium rosae]NTE89741.1 LuxR family transcriptional regulator [Agrobacterium rubi]NTF05409.1 LuxR family transcriptional regulator [Agrobacterium rubi]NTF39853.1 LuxR family transcriptional regulator [Agrobacterium rubi]OCJ44843.1 histidine kinase [Agrobacterium rubi]
MTDKKRLSSSLTMIQSINHSDQVENVLRGICGLFSLKHMTFLVVRAGAAPTPYPYYCTTYPKLWTETYLAGNFFEVDPVVDILRWSRLPVDWSALLSEGTSQFFDDARRSDVGSRGMTIPLRGPHGERCLFSVSSDHRHSEWSRLKADSTHELSIISHLLHEKVLSALDLATQRPWRALSPRERQCLEQIAAGLIPKQIAAKLSISESSVRLYLRSARRKLDAKTSHQAVARASFFEMINI